MSPESWSPDNPNMLERHRVKAIHELIAKSYNSLKSWYDDGQMQPETYRTLTEDLETIVYKAEQVGARIYLQIGKELKSKPVTPHYYSKDKLTPYFGCYRQDEGKVLELGERLEISRVERLKDKDEETILATLIGNDTDVLMLGEVAAVLGQEGKLLLGSMPTPSNSASAEVQPAG